MPRNIFSFIFIPILVLTVHTLAQKTRKKLAKPKAQDNVQTPGTFDRLIYWIILVIAVLSTILMGLGWIMGEREMAIVFSVLTLAFWGIIALLKREYNMSYQENEAYFVLNAKGKEYKVYYEDIIDWAPSLNEIQLLDQTKEDKKYIRVNISMLHPEILLRRIVEMTFAGKFQHEKLMDLEDPNREYELVQFLDSYNYSHLVEDYVKQ